MIMHTMERYFSKDDDMEITDAEIVDMADKCTTGDSHTVGGLKLLKMQDVVEIYRMAK